MIKLEKLSDINLAITIRAVEEKFLQLFQQGDLNGTVHTCIGQELSAVSFCNNLNKDDYVFSNHRCHGHFIAFTKDYKSLISELMGKISGVCGGIGGSQHLCNKNFFSNGPQGSLTPVALGAAKACKLLSNNKLAMCFIGDGTMGEGIVYESMNMASLYKVPLIFICENNLYAQSTPISKNLAGSITKRAEAFGLDIFHGNTWDYENLTEKAKDAITHTRSGNPVFFIVDTYRLKAHSKGDDDRDKEEVDHYNKKDVLNKKLKNDNKLMTFYKEIKSEIDSYINEAITHEELSLDNFININKTKNTNNPKWNKLNVKINEKQVNQINQYFNQAINENDRVIIIGEDIKDPYGGAFKVTKGLSTAFQRNVISTPISEAGIVGMGIGMSLLGYIPFVEIMFGDFISYSFDQVITNASKFFFMYNKQVSVPLTIRTPMGGGRGYGPTHSQSIEKFFNGINNIQIVALNTLINSNHILKSIEKNNHTTILIENKLDYGRLTNKLPKTVNYNFSKSLTEYPIIIGSPDNLETEISIITYGGAVHVLLESIDEIFYEFEVLPKIVVLTKLYPLPIKIIESSVNDSKIVLTLEESNIEGGIGSEIIASLAELKSMSDKKFKRIGSRNVPIPSAKLLEEKILINSKDIIDGLRSMI